MIKKILLAPIELLKKLINLVKLKRDPGTIKKNKKELNPLELEEIARSWFNTYKEEIQFKLILGENGNELNIYSKNFKTTLDKSKKRKEKENESNEDNSSNESN